MPSALSRPLAQLCLCGNDDPLKIRQYRNPRVDEFLGIYCENCKREWLSENTLDSSIFNYDDELQLGQKSLRHFEVPKEESCGSNLPVGPHTKIEDLSMVKEGDHLAFDRPYVIWHHAIVNDVDKANNRLEVYEWTSDLTFNGVRKVWLDLEKERGALYRIDYDEGVEKSNPIKLVIARAHSFIIRNIKGSIFTRNCEHFSRFCKVGVSKSIQVKNLAHNVIRGVVKATGKAVGKAIPRIPLVYGFGEGIEILTKGSQAVGACVVIIVEGFFMFYDIGKIYSQRESGGISFKEFIMRTIVRISEALFSTMFTVGLGIGGEMVGAMVGTLICPGAGTVVGAFVGGAIGGTIGSIVGHMGGNPVGKWIAELIVKHIKYDDREVPSISELSAGDQIVLYGNLLHPRHHAIVVEHDGVSKLKVIHKTYKRGVIEEWIDFTKPIYKVIYAPNTHIGVEESIRRARSKKDGPNEYCLLTNNCKHFIQWCKENSQ